MQGQLTVIDLNECDCQLVKDKSALERYLKELVEYIEMKAYGEPIIKRFGKGDLEGYSGIQLIETSNISVHMDEFENKVFIDIFSCKSFDSEKAAEFSKNFFRARKIKFQTIYRK